MYVLGLPKLKFHKLGLKQPKCLLSHLEAKSPKARCQQGHAASESGKGNSSLPLPSFWWLPEILGIPWLVDTSLQFLAPSLCDVFTSFSVSKFPVYKDTSYIGLAAPRDLIIIGSDPHRPYFQMKSYPEALGFRTSTHGLRGRTQQEKSQEHFRIPCI